VFPEETGRGLAGLICGCEKGNPEGKKKTAGRTTREGIIGGKKWKGTVVRLKIGGKPIH